MNSTDHSGGAKAPEGTADQSGRPLRLRAANTFLERLLGLHAYADLPWHTGLCIRPCKAIHTFGLAYAIDVVFFDRTGRILKQCHRVPPWRWAFNLRAAYVVELPAGYCASHPDFAASIANAMRLSSGLRESPILPSTHR